jgi:hypothetical protein
MAVSGSPVFDPGVATPAPGAAAAFDQTVSSTRQDASNSLTDYGTDSGRMAQKYNNVVAPQLQGSIATSGNWYSNAGQDQIGQGYQDYTNSQADLASSVQRHLDTLTQQRNWAAIGMIV